MADHDLSEMTVNSIGVNLNRNLTKLMKDDKVSPMDLCRNTGIALPTIKRLQEDPNTNPTIQTLIPIAYFFGVSIDQLLGFDPLPIEVNRYRENKTHWVKVPLISWYASIDWMNQSQHTSNSFVLVDVDVGTKPFAVVVEDDDCVNIPKGSILIINTDIKAEHMDYVIVYKAGQEKATLKKLLKDEDKIYLQHMNSAIPPSLLDKDHSILGVLIQIRKNTKD